MFKYMSILFNKLIFYIKSFIRFIFFFLNQKKLVNELNENIRFLSIETTNICNANCIFCAYQYQSRPTGLMDMDLFEKVVEQYAQNNVGNVNLTPTVGEPLADKYLLKRIKFIKKFKNIKKIGIYTNLISLKNFDLKEFVSSGLTDLGVSASGFDKDMYERVYRSKMYPKVYNNLIDLLKINNELGRPINITIDLRSDLSLSETFNLPDQKKLLEYTTKDKFFYKFRYDNWAGKIKQNDLIGIMKLRNKFNLNFNNLRVSPCSEFFSGPHVYWNGDVGICGCRDVDAKELIIGSIKDPDTNINHVWANKKREKLIDEFISSPKSICTNCSHYNNLSVFN